ncbi:MAG: hypothetical protein ACLFR2_08985 [Candidatus Kapaibacterium sp.]
MSIEQKFSNELNNLAKEGNNTQYLKKLLSEFNAMLEQLNQEERRDLLKRISSSFKEINSENPEFVNFVNDFTNWTYSWVKKSADKPQNICSKCSHSDSGNIISL